ncbi:hypothetical protein [Pseudonocardia sp. KRD291]|uniref:hypothetical protein n=1 Tax=Pseudonocardia sp. KRD291 TaxID=2792007 RepID=UPI001C4A0E7C|nr:hypothetical protein [Pseudonocardia sp. KRD291]MBW0105663.1 hypothetical protein [Pseudonocardia sp. KRD291]
MAVLLFGAAPAQGDEPESSTSGVDVAAVPAPARESLPEIEELTADYCPELPPVWVVAQVEAESGWDPDLRTGDALGLFQLGERTWTAAGGKAWPDPDVTDPSAHLRIAVPWMCSTLRAVAGHLATNPKQTSVLDAMLVCHIAGCRRVTGSATGVPAAGEAGCSQACSGAVRRYLDAVHANLTQFSAGGDPTGATPSGATPSDDRESPDDAAPRGVQRPGPAADRKSSQKPATASEPGTAEKAGAAQKPEAGREQAAEQKPGVPQKPSLSAPAAAWTGGKTSCAPPDPTRGEGCLTGATRHGLEAAELVFGGLDGGPVVQKAGCWDEHAWNPSSDHPKGRACDLFPGTAGTFPKGTDLDHGWEIAHWFEANAAPLKVRYLIWQGRYWDPSVKGDGSGWGRRYTGGGVYDTKDPTGGHYDHVHVSFAE